MSEEIVNQEEELDEETQEDFDGTAEETTEEPAADDVEEVPEEETIDWEARAKKAEALLIQNKRKAKQEVKQPSALTEEAVEEKILRANGLDSESVSQLKKIARLNNSSLLDAQNDPIYIAWKKNDQEAKEKAANRLGASKGSSTVKPKKDFQTPGLTDEEHKEMWKRNEGR